MILQYFRKKENEYKKKADKIYITILSKSKYLIKSKYFNEAHFDSSFELISILLVLYLKAFKEKDELIYKKINDELVKNFINDLDNTMRERGVGDMSIGKYVKKYVKKFYYRIKIIDPILNNYNYVNFTKYLKSIKYINEKHALEMSKELLSFYNQIK